MLLAASSSNHQLMIGVRPRAVTTPVRLGNPSGTWAKMSSRREDLSFKPAPAPGSSTRGNGSATKKKKAHWLSTVRVPGPRANLTLAGQFPTPSSTHSDDDDDKSLPNITVPPVSTETSCTPVVAAVPPPACPESPLAHARRGAVFNVPPPCIVSSDTTHTLSIALPRPGGAPLAPEMVTVSVRRGGRLVVVADAWHLEHDCEWRRAGGVPSSFIVFFVFSQVIMSGMLRCPPERSIWVPYEHALARMGLWLSMCQEAFALSDSHAAMISQRFQVKSLLLVSEWNYNR